MQKILITLLLAGATLGAAPVTQATLINSGNPIKSDGRFFVGPYTLRINGRNVPVLCIDFLDQTKAGSKWSAYISQVGGDIGETYHPGDAVQYEEEAYLYTLIIEPDADRVNIQHAAWALTDPAFEANSAARFWLELAARNYLRIPFEDYEIISERPGQKDARKQEFLVATPEPPLLELLVGGIALAAAICGRKRS